MTDRELLELAAKAASLNLGGWNADHNGYYVGPRQPLAPSGYWNPRDDDGDALRLAAMLHLDICWNQNEGPWEVNAWPQDNGIGSGEGPEDHGDDSSAATRLAILRASADIGAAA